MINRIISFVKKHCLVIQIFFLALWLCVNFFFALKHEPWRDEIHAYLMAKNLSIKELIIVSRFDGHPILWHLILMPFAKLKFPIFTIQLINYFICSIAAYIFYFKVKMNKILKTIILFGVPFIYVYTAIARNYCLILLLVVLLAYLYSSRYKHPYWYTLLLCLLLNTPIIAWGLAIALYLSFNFVEIIKLYQKKSILNIKQIIITNLMFIIILLLLVLELYGTSNTDYPKPYLFISYSYQINCEFFVIILSSLFIFGIVSLLIYRKIFKEYLVAFVACLTQIIITLYYYSYVLEVRQFYQCIIWLFFIIVTYEEKKKYCLIMPIVFICFYFCLTLLSYSLAFNDIKTNYSSAKETANWINNNIKDKKILTQESVFTQSLVPYLKHSKLYDIYYDDYFNNLKEYNNNHKKKNVKLSLYKGHYIVVFNDQYIPKNRLKKVYSSHSSIMNEGYSVYYIN